MRRMAGIGVAGVLLTAMVTACGNLDSPAGSVRDAAEPSSPSPSRTTGTPSPATTRPSATPTTRTPTTARPTSTPPATRPSLSPADVPNLPVSQLLSMSRTAARSVKTVHVRATIKIDNGATKMLIDVNVDRETENFFGSASTDKYVLSLVRIGESVWIKGSEQYWLVEGEGQFTPEEARYLSAKFLRTTTADPSASGIVTGVLQASNPEYVLDHLSDRSQKLPLQQFEGWTLIPISASSGTTGYLNAGLPVYPVRLITVGGDPEADNYDKFNEPVNVTEPPADQVVDVPPQS